MPEYRNTVLYGHVIEELKKLPDEYVQMVVTSPPYWSLRCYAGEQARIWDDNPACEHEWGNTLLHPSRQNRGEGVDPKYVAAGVQQPTHCGGNICQKCGAWRGALGLEPDFNLYIKHLVDIFREVRRVLRKDGTLWLNMGDNYTCGGRGGDPKYNPEVRKSVLESKPDWKSIKLSQKNLCMIPARVALALQDDGWTLRSDIIWKKVNTMPEAVKDRPTKSHEHIFLFAKNTKNIYWTHRSEKGTRIKPKSDYIYVDAKTECEQKEEPENWKSEMIICPECKGHGKKSGNLCFNCSGKEIIRRWKRINLWEGQDYYYDAKAIQEKYALPLNRWGGESLKKDTTKTTGYKEIQKLGNSSAFRVGRPMRPDSEGRNCRDVWDIRTKNYNGAHFATFPEEIPRRTILAGSSHIACSVCGAPWERMLKKDTIIKMGGGNGGKIADINKLSPSSSLRTRQVVSYITIGWTPTCACEAGKCRCIVLDPFAGSGTTLAVAREFGRDFIGIEIAEDYRKLINNRLSKKEKLLPLFTEG